MNRHTLTINRAPVLTLWAAVVAERLGYAHGEALTLGKAVAGLNAQAKGERIGIFAKTAGAKGAGGKAAGEKGTAVKAKPGRAANTVELMGRAIPVTRTKDGMRALVKDKPTDPAAVERYLVSKFGDALDEARAAFAALARARGPAVIASEAYALYEEFRPEIPAGQRGWGAKGVLDLDRVRALATKGAK
jgi:hypothetical protein